MGKRLDRLNIQQAALANGVTLGNSISVMETTEGQQIMSQAWGPIHPALPTTFTGIVFAIIGWIVGFGSLLGLRSLVNTRKDAAA